MSVDMLKLIELVEASPSRFVQLDDGRFLALTMGLAADFRLIMTGTPLENHLGELWNLFQFINPGLLGSLKHFQHRFVAPSERDGCHEMRRRLKKLRLDRIVAVKMILGGHLASESDVQRFYLEAKAAGKLSHPESRGSPAPGERHRVARYRRSGAVVR